MEQQRSPGKPVREKGIFDGCLKTLLISLAIPVIIFFGYTFYDSHWGAQANRNAIRTLADERITYRENNPPSSLNREDLQADLRGCKGVRRELAAVRSPGSDEYHYQYRYASPCISYKGKSYYNIVIYLENKSRGGSWEVVIDETYL